MTLIDRLEAAETGSSELDCLVMIACGLVPIQHGLAEGWHYEFDTIELMGSRRTKVQLWPTNDAGNRAEYSHGIHDAESYTTSVDAALTLIPEGWLLTLVGDLHAGFSATGARCHLMSWEHESDAEGSTRPLAICVAAIKARNAE